LDTRTEVGGAFAEAVQVAFREMAATEPVLRDWSTAPGDEGVGDLCASLRVATATGEGYLVLSFCEQTAAMLAQRVLIEVAAEPDIAMIRDCVGEVLNVIAGQAKTLLHGTPYHFSLSTPIVGSEVLVLAGEAPRWVAVFDSTLGRFSLHIHLPL
jgi:chemotaxis protein CheX